MGICLFLFAFDRKTISNVRFFKKERLRLEVKYLKFALPDQIWPTAFLRTVVSFSSFLSMEYRPMQWKCNCILTHKKHQKFKFFQKGRLRLENIWDWPLEQKCTSFQKRLFICFIFSLYFERSPLLQTVSVNKLLRRTDRQIVSQGAKNVAKCQEKTCFWCTISQQPKLPQNQIPLPPRRWQNVLRKLCKIPPTIMVDNIQPSSLTASDYHHCHSFWVSS